MRRKLVVVSILAFTLCVAGCSSDKSVTSKDAGQEAESDKNVTLESGKFVQGEKEVFEEFAKNTWNGKEDSIILEYLDDGSLSSKIEITFDGDKYKYHTLYDSEYVLEKYKYLHYFEGTYKDRYTYADYILLNDEDMTYDSFMRLIIDSNPGVADTPDEAGFRYILADHKDLE